MVGRKALFALIIAVASGALFAAPWLTARAIEVAASMRGLNVEIGSLQLGWHRLAVSRLRVAAMSKAGFEATASDAQIDFKWSGRIDRIDANGVSILWRHAHDEPPTVEARDANVHFVQVESKTGHAQTFSYEIVVPKIVVQSRFVAAEPVALPLSFSGRATVPTARHVHIEKGELKTGQTSIEINGDVSREHSDWGVRANVNLHAPNCQALLDSIPSPLVPNFSGASILGTFEVKSAFHWISKQDDETRFKTKSSSTDTCSYSHVPFALSAERLRAPFSYSIYRADGSRADRITGPGAANWTPLSEIATAIKVFIPQAEDVEFYEHQGFSLKALERALVLDLQEHRIVTGGSSITMQLAKNLFLSRDRTIANKVKEVVLASYLESSFSKSELLELYLNVVEFGPNTYGVADAAQYYFARSPRELTVEQSAFLASILPCPLKRARQWTTHNIEPNWSHDIRWLIASAGKPSVSDDELLATLTQSTGDSAYRTRTIVPRSADELSTALQPSGSVGVVQ